MKGYKDMKGKILDILKKNPEGSTIQKISDSLKISRLTATKYIHELLGEGKIYERKVGIARLLFSREGFLKTVEKRELTEKILKKLG